MALNILNETLIIDETVGLDPLSDDTAFPVVGTNLLIDYMRGLTRGTAGNMPAPELAVQTDFVKATASAGETISAVFLVQESGAAFSTTVGVDSGLKNVDGFSIYLFQDPTNASVILGVVGNVVPTATTPLSFSMALVQGATTGSGDLYVVQYEALFNPVATNPDDPINLGNTVFASVTGTKVVEFSQLSDAPSGNNEWYILNADAGGTSQILVSAITNGVRDEVNVSTQGLGAGPQHTGPGSTLQIDIINGGTQSAGDFDVDDPKYGTHIETTVLSAGFTVSQTNPTGAEVDLLIRAVNDAGDEEGTAFRDDATFNAVNITDVIFKVGGVVTSAATLGIGVDFTGDTLKLTDVPQGVTIDFVATSPFDRFLISNVEVPSSPAQTLDIVNLHFTETQTNAYKEAVGGFIVFEDDGPKITAVAAAVGALALDESNLTAGTNGIDGTTPNLDSTTKSLAASSLISGTLGVDDGAPLNFKLGINFDNTTGHTGLFDNATHSEVLLRANPEGTLIEGYVGTDTVVFSLSLAADGTISLTQLRAVDQGTADTPTDLSEGSGLSGTNLITLTGNLTDTDLDPASAGVSDLTGAIRFLDDGPTIGAIAQLDAKTGASGEVDFTSGAHNTGTIGGVDGADGAELNLVSIEDTSDISVRDRFDIVQTGNHVDFYVKGSDRNVAENKWFTLDVNDNGPGTDDTYDFQVLQTEVNSEGEALNFKIGAGKPQETLTVNSVFGNAEIKFDGLIFKGGQTDQAGNPNFTNSLSKNVDDINPDNLGFGIMGNKPDQASQVNQNEGFVAYLGENTDNFNFKVQGIGNNADGVQIEYWLVKDNDTNPLNNIYDGADKNATLIAHDSQDIDVLSGNALSDVNLDHAMEFNEVFVRAYYTNDDLQNGGVAPGKGALDNAGVRFQHFSIETADTFAEYSFRFGVSRTDDDELAGVPKGDTTSVATFDIHVNPDFIL